MRDGGQPIFDLYQIVVTGTLLSVVHESSLFAQRETVMSLKSILVPTDGTDIDRQLLDLALAVGWPTNAHITALYPKRDPREALAYAGMGMGTELIAIGPIMEQLENEGRGGSARARATFEAWRGQAGLAEAAKPGASDRVTVGFSEQTGSPDELVIHAGAKADLIVHAGLKDDTGFQQELLEASLFGAARPVLVAPPKPTADPFKCALVAWNGSHEANRAVAAALALLPRFERVCFFYRAEPHRAPADPAEPIELMGWHGIAAEVATAGPATDSIGADLLAAASSVGASLLIMGAYTHGRVREMVFGGVTHHVLHHASLPVFLAH
jgi:nucleotide-binding universal stress UspA family protein